MGLDEVQAAYDVALRRVRADLVGDVSDRFEVSVDFTDPDDLQYRYSHEDGSGHGCMLSPTEDVEEATVELARPFQDDILEAICGPAWPSCPGHPHPAEPALCDGAAVWQCPATGEIVRPIGGIGP